jgi:hypothetical protein
MLLKRLNILYMAVAACLMPVVLALSFSLCNDTSGLTETGEVCCCCKSEAIAACCCELDTLANPDSGSLVSFLLTECVFDQYAPTKMSCVIITEDLVFIDVSYFIFKPPKV